MTIDSTPEGTLPSETPAPASVPPPAPRRSIAGPLLLGIVLGAGAAAGGYFASEGERDALPSSAPNDALQRLDARLSAEVAERQRLSADIAAARSDLAKVAERVGTLEGDRVRTEELTALQNQVRALAERLNTSQPTTADPAALAVAATRTNDLATGIGDLRAALADLQNRPSPDPAVITAAAAAANEARAQADAANRQVAALQARLQQVEARERAPDPAATRAGVVVAATQLRDRMARSGPFAAELSAFRAAAGDIDDIALKEALLVLDSIAAKGVPPIESLRRRFERDSATALAATDGAPQGWTESVLRNLRGLVRVRRTGDEQPDTDAGHLALAEQRLALNDVPSAVAHVAALTAPARAAMAGWIAEAEDRIVADHAADTIASRAVALVTAHP